MSNRSNSGARNRKRGGGNRPLKANGDNQPPPLDPPGQKLAGTDDGGDNPKETPRATRAENVIAGFTGALFFAAVVQGAVSWGQWNVAQRALLDDETPQVRLLFSPLDFNAGKSPEIMLLIHNGSRATLFNGQVSGWFGVVATNAEASGAWNRMETLASNVVMGPDEDQSFTYKSPGDVPARTMDALLRRKAAIMVIGKIEYPDSGKRIHQRYVCTLLYNSGGRFVPQACNTPTQS